jgi:hypothetical protein
VREGRDERREARKRGRERENTSNANAVVVHTG